MFISWHYSSQACGELFKTTRSMVSNFSTVVNFTMKDILTRIELLNMIQNYLHENHQNIQSSNPSHSDDIPSLLNPSQNTYVFPRYEKCSRHFINSAILAASLNDAKLSVTTLGKFFIKKKVGCQVN